MLHRGFLRFVSRRVRIVGFDPFCDRTAWVAGEWAECSWAVFGECDGLVVVGPVLQPVLVLVVLGELLRHFDLGLERRGGFVLLLCMSLLVRAFQALQELSVGGDSGSGGILSRFQYGPGSPCSGRLRSPCLGWTNGRCLGLG